MEKESNILNKESNKSIEKEIEELSSSIINIKIKKNRPNKKLLVNNELKKENENEKNNENKSEQVQNNNEGFNLDDFNNFVKQNVNVQISSNNNNNQLKSHLKPHLKINLNLGTKKKLAPIKINQENNIEKEKGDNIQNNDEDIKNNININEVTNQIKNDNDIIQINNELNNNNIPNNNLSESSFILKQKFDNINESQISYETNLSFQNMNISSFPEKKKVKKKFKLSLYQLQKLALLGVGASGEVYLVQDTKTKKKLALKSVKYTEDEKTKNQLETEVKLGTLLKHENIIRIYATYFLKGRINFVMEYMDKGTLSDLLKKFKKIPEKYMGIITYQVMQGLAYCQKEKKIIHRDLKPSNILVNSKGEIKIADFGVSAIVEGSWAQKKTMIGTYIYMAPERIDYNSYTLNSDIWSLGIIVMECLLGYYPYIIYNNNNLPNSYWTVHELIENNPIPTLDSEVYSKELIDFIKQCLIKDNNKRPKAAVLINHPFIQKYANDISYKQDFANWIKSI